MPSAMAIFAILLQISWTGKIGNWSDTRWVVADLSLSYWTLADLLLLFLFIPLFSLRHCEREPSQLKYQSFLENFKKNNWIWPSWLLLFTLWMSFSLIFGYYQTGHLSQETVMNKYIGWCILALYFLFGGVLAKTKKPLEIFLKTLFIVSALISTLCITEYYINNNHIISSLTLSFPFSFPSLFHFYTPSINSSFALFSAFVVLVQIPFLTSKKLFNYKIHLVLISSNIVSVFLFGTKSILFALGTGLWCFIVHNILARYRKYTKYILLLFFIMSLLIYNYVDLEKIKSYPPIATFNQDLNSGLLAQQRMVKETAELWRTLPLTGIGLGKISENKNVQNTLLMLLAEIGLIGVALYLWFIIKGARHLFRKKYAGEANELMMAMLMVLPAFVAASFTTEIFYQRYIWLLWGAALMGAKETRRSIHETS